MPRRVELPGAAELFGGDKARTVSTGKADRAAKESSTNASSSAKKAKVQSSGRVRHEEKITVYISTEELLAIESARLQLRSEYEIPADRGRIVRAAIVKALADFSEKGAKSDLVKRLQEQ